MATTFWLLFITSEPSAAQALAATSGLPLLMPFASSMFHTIWSSPRLLLFSSAPRAVQTHCPKFMKPLGYRDAHRNTMSSAALENLSGLSDDSFETTALKMSSEALRRSDFAALWCDGPDSEVVDMSFWFVFPAKDRLLLGPPAMMFASLIALCNPGRPLSGDAVGDLFREAPGRARIADLKVTGMLPSEPCSHSDDEPYNTRRLLARLSAGSHVKANDA
mmetsp:Transcript_38930/g.99458  ORF Transcript_38930/g.99458 Transcript_38930/m.99458 type:complete len:220 (+) Transcript_38930:474-1133(+)